MDWNKVRKVISLLQDNPTIAELEIRNMMGFSKILIRRSNPSICSTARQSMEQRAVRENLYIIESPCVGWFLAAADLEENPPLVEGGYVSPGEIVGYIEVHGLRTDVVSEFGGTIKNVHAETGRPVEYGQKLYTIIIADPS